MTFGALGSGSGQLKVPYSLAVDSKGNVWITDQANSRVEEFNEKGVFVKTFGWGVSDGKSEAEVCTTSCKAGIAGAGGGQFKEPKGIAVSAGGNVYVTDTANSRIEEFNEAGKFINTFGYGVGEKGENKLEVCTSKCKAGKAGAENGEFNGPRNLTVTSTGKIWVIESANTRVQEFNEKDEYALKFGSAGTGNGQFSEPKGITLAANGDVIVADEGNDRIQEFTSSGTFLTTFGSKGSGPGQFEEPVGLAFALNGTLYVTDTKNDRIEEWTSNKGGAHTTQTILQRRGD